MNVYSNCVTKYSKEMSDKKKYGQNITLVYLGSVTTVLSVWHLNHYSEVNGVLHNPVVQCLRKIMHMHCIRFVNKLVLKLLEQQCLLILRNDISLLFYNSFLFYVML